MGLLMCDNHSLRYVGGSSSIIRQLIYFRYLSVEQQTHKILLTMQFGFGVGPDTSWMRKELTDLGVEELKTPEEVDQAMSTKNSGTMLLVINSVCGCAAGNARPGLKIALDKSENKPDHLTTVFAGQDKE